MCSVRFKILYVSSDRILTVHHNHKLHLLTFFSGRYIFFETSHPAKEGDVACFYSPKIPPASCQRLAFWYHMYGAQMGTLRVLKKIANGSTTTLWERSFQQGMNWLRASVVISSKTPFQVQKCRKRNCFEIEPSIITPLFLFW